MIEKRESDFKKKQFLERVVKTLGKKVASDDGEIFVEKNDENKVVDLLTKSGLKYQKVA